MRRRCYRRLEGFVNETSMTARVYSFSRIKADSSQSLSRLSSIPPTTRRYVCRSCHPHQRDCRIPQRRHHLRYVPATHLRLVLFECHISDIVQLVLYVPVLPP